MSVSNIPPSNLIVSQMMAATRPKISSPSPPPPASSMPSGSPAMGTTNLFQQLSSGLQSFFLQLQSSVAYGGAGTQTVTAAGPTNADPTTTVDSDGDDDPASGSSQSLGYVRRRPPGTQEAGGAEQSQTEPTDGLSRAPSLADAPGTAGGAMDPVGSATMASTFFAAIQAYAKTAAQSPSSSTPDTP